MADKPELTLESLAARVEALEKRFAELKAEATAEEVDRRGVMEAVDGQPDYVLEVTAEGRAIHKTGDR